jgi:LemA protein
VVDARIVTVFAALAAALLLWIAARLFNRLVAARNACSSARSSIDVQLVKRHDLIPNLTRAVAGYAAHERAALEAVAAARTAAMAALGRPGSARAEAQLESRLALLMRLVEAYPQLKASDNFLHLQKTLTEVEEQLAAARRTFNAHVLVLNNLAEQFPTSVVARLAGFARLEFFAAGARERAASAPVAEQLRG